MRDRSSRDARLRLIATRRLAFEIFPAHGPNRIVRMPMLLATCHVSWHPVR